jgi:ubiquitin carboxyl-terminal hydrolase 7
VSLLVSRQATVEEVIQALVKKLPSIPAEVYDRIRLFDVRGHREYREFQPTQALSTTSIDTSYGSSFFAEPVPTEEDEAGEHDKFIIIVHFAKDIARLHGVPLKFVMKPVLLIIRLCLFIAGIVV